MIVETTTFTQNGWAITVSGNKDMYLVNIEQRDDIAATITWEDGQAKITPRMISSMTVDEANDYAVHISIAADVALKITEQVKEIIGKLPA